MTLIFKVRLDTETVKFSKQFYVLVVNSHQIFNHSRFKCFASRTLLCFSESSLKVCVVAYREETRNSPGDVWDGLDQVLRGHF